MDEQVLPKEIEPIDDNDLRNEKFVIFNGVQLLSFRGLLLWCYAAMFIFYMFVVPYESLGIPISIAGIVF